ncbi:MAG: endonuclease Q family protein [Microgenomates group bacterium]
MRIIADLHLHSRFSRAVSREMTIKNLYASGVRKGIGLIATGDWTHPLWMGEIESELEEMGNGFLQLKGTTEGPKFLLSTEISCIFSQNGKTRRVHTLIWVPTIASAIKISQEITKQGGNVLSDGRPILGFTLIRLAELVLTIEPKALIVPAHIWTPWFSVYGKMGGFDSLKEAFGEYEKYIYAVETGLSSSPDMNWQIGELDTRSIVSFSDAHSGPKLGREATIFSLPSLSFEYLTAALKNYKNNPKLPHIESTIEFYPEEGKYHYTGHRDCHIRLTPKEVEKKGTTCPVCGKPLTQGVMQRVSELATRPLASNKTTTDGMSHYENVGHARPPFIMLVPLMEIIAEALGRPVTSPRVQERYDALIKEFTSDFAILMHVSIEEIARVSLPEIADGIKKVRTGDIVIDPGYDGVFGVVKIWKSEKDRDLVSAAGEQESIF